jgi:tRNA pseudouridine38-40 synthase
LPKDISINSLIPVKSSAHARFDASSRAYQYRLYFKKDPFKEGQAYHYKYGKLNMAKMNKAAEILLKQKDFTSFSKLHTQVKTNICKVRKASWERKGEEWVFTITADRFLRGMVRAIVGTLLQVGSGKISVGDFKRITESLSIEETDFSAPAEGLYLSNVKYPYPLKAR